MELEGDGMLDNKSKSYVKLLIKKELCSTKFIVLVFFNAILCGTAYYGLPFYLANSTDSIGFWEIFACFLGSRNTQLFYMTGIVFLLGGFPYAGNNISLYIIRGNKKQWVTANVLTIIFETFIYYICLVLINICMCISGISFRNQWTTLFKNLPNSDLGEKIYSWLDIDVEIHRFNEIQPMNLCMIIIMMVFLSSLCIGMIIFLCSMYQNKRMGILLSFMLIIGGSFDPGLKGFEWYQYIQNINIASYASKYWSGQEPISGQLIFMICAVDISLISGFILWSYRLIKQKDWIVEE